MSYNLPKFCPNAAWDSDADNFADHGDVGNTPKGIFVNTENTVYVADFEHNKARIRLAGSSSFTDANNGNWQNPRSLFVNIFGDIYIDKDHGNNAVEKWTKTTTSSNMVLDICNSCSCNGLFVDSNNTLYCSIEANHEVVKKSLDTSGTSQVHAAGSGSASSGSGGLNSPQGIFVDFQLRLYVADMVNNRIQRFTPGNSSATTVAGAAIPAPGTITLNNPRGVVLDGDEYLFIVDGGSHSIIRSTSSGFRCVAACSGVSGNVAGKLNQPQTMSFDTYGNIFVTDTNNNRVQKFSLLPDSCSKLSCASVMIIRYKCFQPREFHVTFQRVQMFPGSNLDTDLII